jgi:D-arabinose 1-dehydrogenase-like Zn-dependent alcohol dehydrogenase
MPGDLVAVQGVGGLGHLGIQFAKRAGYRVAAVGRGTQNAAIARKLGADVYIDSAATDAAAELQKLGGASVVLATAPSGKAMSSILPGLTANGTLVVVGASEDPLEVSTALLILGRRNIKGWSAEKPSDSEDTLRFAEASGVHPMIEKLPLEKAAEGYARMMSGERSIPRCAYDGLTPKSVGRRLTYQTADLVQCHQPRIKSRDSIGVAENLIRAALQTAEVAGTIRAR